MINDFTKADLEGVFSSDDIIRFIQPKWDLGDKFRLIWIGLASVWNKNDLDGVDASYGALLEQCFDEMREQTKVKQIKTNINDTFDAILNEFDSGAENETFIMTLQRKIKELQPHKEFFEHSGESVY